MKLSDLHIHSTFSDGKLTIPEIVDFYGMRSFDIIAITDHLCEEETFLGKASNFLNKTLTRQTFDEYLDIIRNEGERAMKEYGMLVIAGVELTKNSLSFHRSAHILALGISSFISADESIQVVLSKIREQGAMAIAAHPVSTKNFEHQTYHLWDNRFDLAESFDAWEVASGPHLFEEVIKSGLPMVANSDFHHPGHLRSWKTMIKCELNFSSFKDAIKQQEIELVFYHGIKSQTSSHQSFQKCSPRSLNGFSLVDETVVSMICMPRFT